MVIEYYKVYLFVLCEYWVQSREINRCVTIIILFINIDTSLQGGRESHSLTEMDRWFSSITRN